MIELRTPCWTGNFEQVVGHHFLIDRLLLGAKNLNVNNIVGKVLS
jgi:hypothetical protein